MAFDFPSSPTVGQTYTSGGVTYRWDGQGWGGGPLYDSGLYQPKDANLTALAALADGAIGVPEFDGAGGSSVRPVATIAEFRAGVAIPRVLGNKSVWDAAAEVSIPYVASWTPDMATFINALMAPTGALAINNPVNPVSGRSGLIRFFTAAIQNVTFGTNWFFPTGTKPTTLYSDTGLYYYVTGTGAIFCSYVGPYTNA
jgi:hypothetical protein